MSSIIINADNITNTTTNSTFQVDFDRTINLNDKHISLTSASMYFSWRNITTQVQVPARCAASEQYVCCGEVGARS